MERRRRPSCARSLKLVKFARFHDEAFRNLNSQRIQVNELWALIYAKDKNVTPDIAAKHEGVGKI